MEEKQATPKTSEDLKRPTVDAPLASPVPPRSEVVRQGAQGLRAILGRTKSKLSQAEEIRPELTEEAPAVSSKTELNDQRVSTDFVRVMVEYQLTLTGQ